MIMTSLRPEYRREVRHVKSEAQRLKLSPEHRAVLLARAKARHEERKAAR